MTICDQFREWAEEALDEWDGHSTAELFLMILDKTGEKPRRILYEVENLVASRRGLPERKP